MTEESRVLCLSEDSEFAARLSAPLELSYPEVTVFTAEAADDAVEVLESERLDCLVTDYATAATHPALLAAVREYYPEMTLLLLSPYDTGDGGGIAIAEVVDFLDELGQGGTDGTFAGWVANSVVGEPGTPVRPGGNTPQDTVRDIKQALSDATSPVDIEHAVCEQLTAGDRFQFVWIGEHDRGEGQVVPWVSASADDDWPLSRTFPVGTDGEDSLIERVLRTDTPRYVDVGVDPASIPWGGEAIDRGSTEAAFYPLSTEDDRFGVMGVYTDDPDGFDEMERSALDEIASTTAYVLETMAIRGRIEQQERTLKRYERLVETVGDGMYALDEEGHFMTINDALLSMSGYTREGILGEHIGIVLDEEGRSETEAAIDHLRTDEADGTVTHEVQLRPKTGEPFPCENQIALLTYDDSVQGCVGVLRDVTERKERERKLREQNERLEAFASIVSHDLRNPLTVATGYLEMLDGEENRAAVDEIRTSLDRMEEIIEDVLALARNGESDTETTPFDLETLVETGWDNVDTGRAELTVRDSAVIDVDRSQVLRLFENLFRNAIQHGGEDVTVTVGLLADEQSTGFYVADDGPGMDPAVGERVFESSFTTDEQGFGLGLWVVREIAQAHGWSPGVTESENGGARFEFRNVELSSK